MSVSNQNNPESKPTLSSGGSSAGVRAGSEAAPRGGRSGRHAKQQIDPTLTVILHRQSGGWHAIAVRRESGTDRLLDARRFGGADTSSLRRWVDERAPGQIIGVLPASRVICRSCQLPNQPIERLVGALQLQAEAHLLGAVPPHRLVMAALAASPGDTGRTGLIVGWPESASIPDNTLGLEMTWTADVVALASFVGGAPLLSPAMSIDRSEGSIALAVPHAHGVAFRATTEDFAGNDEWRQEITRVVAETALGSGHSGAAVKELLERLSARLAEADGSAGGSAGGSGDGSRLASTSLLVLPPDAIDRARARVSGVNADPTWWNDYGIALGAFLAAQGELRPLTTLRATPLRERPSAISRAATALAQPRTAVMVGLVALVLAAFGPLAFAEMRLALLRTKVPDLEALEEENREESRRRAMYAEMRRQTWPMTKLLADIANCTPEGIELDSIGLVRGDGISIQGIARKYKDSSATDRVILLKTQMERTGIFDRITHRVDPSAGAGVNRFRLNADVKDAFRTFPYPKEQDYAVTSLAVRRYGPQADPNYKESEDGESGAVPAAGPGASGARAAATPQEPSSDGLEARPEEAPGDVASAESTDGPDGSNPTSGPGRGGRTSGRGAATDPAGAAKGESETKDAATAEGEEKAADRRADGRNVARRGGETREGGPPAEGGAAAPRGPRPASAAATVPDPLSEAQINVMSRSEAQSALAKVAQAKLLPDLDEETAARLLTEFGQLLKRTKEAK